MFSIRCNFKRGYKYSTLCSSPRGACFVRKRFPSQPTAPTQPRKARIELPPRDGEATNKYYFDVTNFPYMVEINFYGPSTRITLRISFMAIRKSCF